MFLLLLQFVSPGSEVSIDHEFPSLGERREEPGCDWLDVLGVEGVDAFGTCEDEGIVLDVEELGVVSRADNRNNRRRRI